MACGFARFRGFERALTECAGQSSDAEPHLTFYGSGDFHHVSLALVRRVAVPFNLLIVDNHPDWMRGIPFLHCGTWVYHAARLPMLRRIFHVGGDVDFDNAYRWVAPWSLLTKGKLAVFPAVRRFKRGKWAGVGNEPIRGNELRRLLGPFRDDLLRYPLYISLDKDVMVSADAVVNWDSGHLRLAEVQEVLRTFLEAANGQLAGMDIVGDWSPVCVRGLLRHVLHRTEHPSLEIDPEGARARNEQTNLRLLQTLSEYGLIREPSAPAAA
jgi:hypothetical protein